MKKAFVVAVAAALLGIGGIAQAHRILDSDTARNWDTAVAKAWSRNYRRVEFLSASASGENVRYAWKISCAGGFWARRSNFYVDGDYAYVVTVPYGQGRCSETMAAWLSDGSGVVTVAVAV